MWILYLSWAGDFGVSQTKITCKEYKTLSAEALQALKNKKTPTTHTSTHTSTHTKAHPHTKNTCMQQQQQQQQEHLHLWGLSLAIAPNLHLCVGRMGIHLVLLPGVAFLIMFLVCVICFVICAVDTKYLVCFLHHIQYIWQLSNVFQFLLQDVFNVVVIVSIVQYYLIEAALSGKPGMIELVLQIFVVGCTNCLYQFLFISWCSIIETLDGSKNPNPAS